MNVELALMLLPAAALTLNAGAFVFNALSQRQATRQQRAALIDEAFRRFAGDAEMQEAFYLVEYERFTYSNNFHDSTEERQIDRLIRHFSNVALLWQSGLLPIKALLPLRYYVLRLVRNDEVKRYLEFLRDWTKQVEAGPHPYEALLELAPELESVPGLGRPGKPAEQLAMLHCPEFRAKLKRAGQADSNDQGLENSEMERTNR